jgi:5'-3' exonuclease
MECLKQKLNALSKKHIGWIVSGVDEYGEGEHKIMNWLRHLSIDSAKKDSKDIVVYGLDADLILLTMLVGETQNLPMFLLREKQEFGRSLGLIKEKQEYQFMNIREFKEKLGLKTRSDVLNYIGYMSLMGNDFLPHSLTHKLSEDGHDFVLHELRNQREKLIDDDGRVSMFVLKGVFERWSQDEDSRMMHMITKKREQAARGLGKGMSEEDGLPLQWNVEAAFLEGGKLRGGWRDVYWNFLHIQADTDHICQEYLKGVQWIMDYYLGKPVTMSWMFPAWIPPLWSDLARFVSKGVPVDMGEVGVIPSPEEQLAMVLPLESWNLVRSPHLRRLPVELPSMWPRKFGFQSVGRKWLWECEALIPVLTVERLRDASVRDTLNKSI